MDIAAAREEGKRDARDRVRAIFASEYAKANSEAALVFAFETDISAEAVIRALSKLPAAASPRRTLMPHAPPSLALRPDGPDRPANEYQRGAEAFARALRKTL